MEPKFTLDTDAIRKRMGGAIVGIRADGTMAVLVKGTAATFFDLVSGENYWQEEMGEFVTLIRPGDRVECKHREDDDTEWQPRTYWGYSGDNWYPFRVKGELKEGFPHIRPLPK